MKKAVKIILCTLISLILLATVALSAVLLMGYRFTPKQAVHTYWHKGSHIKAGEYDFWLSDVFDGDGELVYSTGHTAVKKYGFLYKELEDADKKVLIDEYGDYVGSFTRYKGKDADYYFIHWMSSVAGIKDGKYTHSMRYFTDKITLNDQEVKLTAHCFFEFEGKIESIEINGRSITVVKEHKAPPVSQYAPRPNDSGLDFWITENVENADFSDFVEIPGWMGAREFYGKGYAPTQNENGNDQKPEHYVTYLITAYPDHADGGQFVTEIRITDPCVSIYGLTVNSTVGEYEAVFQKMGYFVTVDENGSGTLFTASKYGHITFTLRQNYEGKRVLTVKAKVSNNENIQY
jgi:hypothetical protein